MCAGSAFCTKQARRESLAQAAFVCPGHSISNILVVHAKKVIFLDQFLKLKPSKMFEPCND